MTIILVTMGIMVRTDITIIVVNDDSWWSVMFEHGKGWSRLVYNRWVSGNHHWYCGSKTQKSIPSHPQTNNVV